MPNYIFKCLSCEADFELFMRTPEYSASANHNHTDIACPKCGKKPVARIYKLPTITYKGQGFYNTDNKSKQEYGNTWD